MAEYEQKPMEYAVILQQEGTVRMEIHHSKWRTFAALFSSTFLLIWWVNGFAPERIMPVFRTLLAVPVLMNITAWSLWGFFTYLSLIGARKYFPIPKHAAYEEPFREILETYQYARFTLRRQLRRERLIELAIVFQALFIGASLLYVSLPSGTTASQSPYTSSY
jgi:hypothetical protein